MANESKKPVHTIRYGAVRVAIWENEGANGAFFNATFERSYRDDKGKPRSAHAFGLADLGLLQLAAIEAAQWITAEQAARSRSSA
jgi:hypothetical protein